MTSLADHPPIVRWSSYEESLRTWFAAMPREQIHLFVFERFVTDPQSEMNRVFDFLGVERTDITSDDTRKNVSRHPVHLGSYLIANRLLNMLPDRRYPRHFGNVPPAPARWGDSLRRRIKARLDRVMLRGRRPAPVGEHAVSFLRDHLRERNAGLSELCDIDFAAYWPTLK